MDKQIMTELSYYPGCSLASTARENNESLIYLFKHLGFELIELEDWNCCGTFLTVARPDIVTPMVNEIIEGAGRVDADCIVTACAMCHLNLEVRCSLKEKVPVLHFSEVLSLALGLGEKKQKGWFSKHLVDPRPLLKTMHLLR